MEFTKEHKEEMLSNQYFGYGVHKVKIIGFDHSKTDNGKEYVEVAFVDPENESIEDKARVWFTTDKATQYSFNVFKGILIHNTPEAKRDLARKTIDEVANTDKLVELLVDKLIGKEMWFTKYVDPTRTYEKEGRTYQSTNKNIMAYEPKLNESLMPKPKESASEAFEAVFMPKPDVPFKNGGSQPSDWK